MIADDVIISSRLRRFGAQRRPQTANIIPACITSTRHSHTAPLGSIVEPVALPGDGRVLRPSPIAVSRTGVAGRFAYEGSLLLTSA